MYGHGSLEDMGQNSGWIPRREAFKGVLWESRGCVHRYSREGAPANQPDRQRGAFPNFSPVCLLEASTAQKIFSRELLLSQENTCWPFSPLLKYEEYPDTSELSFGCSPTTKHYADIFGEGYVLRSFHFSLRKILAGHSPLC